jgi:hypothetical protein
VLASIRRTYASGCSIVTVRDQFAYAFSKVVCSRSSAPVGDAASK